MIIFKSLLTFHKNIKDGYITLEKTEEQSKVVRLQKKKNFLTFLEKSA